MFHLISELTGSNLSFSCDICFMYPRHKDLSFQIFVVMENDQCFSNSGFWSSTNTHAIWFEFQWRDLMFPGQHVGISLRTTWQWPNTVKYTVMSATHINQVPSMLLSVGWMHTWKVPPPVMRILSACSSTSASSKISVPAHSHIRSTFYITTMSLYITTTFYLSTYRACCLLHYHQNKMALSVWQGTALLTWCVQSGCFCC